MAQASLEKTHAALQKAISNYQRLTGVLPGKIDMGQYPSAQLPGTLEELVPTAKTGNPKIATADVDIKSEQERVNISESNYHPYVYLELSSVYTDGVQDQQEHEMTNAAMVRMNWNLFNGGSDLAATKAAKSRMRQSQSDRNDLALSVEDETKTTWAQFQSSINEVKAYTLAVQQNRETKDIYLQQFSVAQRSLLDVLDSENEVFQSASQLVTSKVNEQLAAYKLLAISGKLISSLGVDPNLYKGKLASAE